jgi:hypothetical protein
MSCNDEDTSVFEYEEECQDEYSRMMDELPEPLRPAFERAYELGGTAVLEEVYRAALKHKEKSMLSPITPTVDRLAILGEEFGEVCRALTYDEGNPEHLKKELIQVAAMALAWAANLE